MERPLKHMARCRAAGTIELLASLRARGIEVGVLSDYPAAAKLHALGIASSFSVVLCATVTPEANIQFLTVMATKMPFVGRG